jgi:hypothetical protein
MPGLPQIREAGIQPAVKPGLPTGLPSTSSSSRCTRQSASAPDLRLAFLPESACLWLPSSVPQESWATVCSPGLVHKETRLRIAQADDALVELRRQLRISSTLRDYKRTVEGTSQRMSTHVRSLMCRFATKTDRCAARYRAAYAALMLLDLGGEWTLRLKPLADKDICSPHRQEDDPTEGKRELSWIWLTPNAGGHPNGQVTEDEISDSKLFISNINNIRDNNMTMTFRYAC